MGVGIIIAVSGMGGADERGGGATVGGGPLVIGVCGANVPIRVGPSWGGSGTMSTVISPARGIGVIGAFSCPGFALGGIIYDIVYKLISNS